MPASDQFVDGFALAAGTAGKPVTYFQPTQPLCSRELLDLYTSFWLVRTVIDTPIELSLASGFEVVGRPEFDFDTFHQLDTELYPEGAIFKAASYGRLLGGSLLYYGFESAGDPANPPPAGARLAFLDVFRKDQVVVAERFNDPSKANYRFPATYIVVNHHRAGLKFHSDRCFRFGGLNGASYSYLEPEWGLSAIQPMLEAFQQYGLSLSQVNTVLSENNLGVLRVSGLTAAINAGKLEDIKQRFRLFNKVKAQSGTVLLDREDEEEFTRIPGATSDLPAILAELRNVVAGSTATPSVILFGSSPAGFSSGAEDLRLYFARLHAQRERSLKRCLEQVLRLANRDQSVNIEFLPLWEQSPEENSRTRATNVASSLLLLERGLMTKAELRKALTKGVLPEDDMPLELPAELLSAQSAAPPAGSSLPSGPFGSENLEQAGGAGRGAATPGPAQPGEA